MPLTEYWNNACERGDFERVLPLIDAYDLLQSDRVNDKQQFADALLVLTGVMGLTAPEDGDGRTPGERLRQDKTLALPDSTARVEWLTKETHESDADVLRRALSEDIHKFSMVPDLTDEQFAANASGVAMRYKLLGLEQLTGVKERYFREGLRCRVRLVRPLPGAAGRKGDRARARALHLHPVRCRSTIPSRRRSCASCTASCPTSSCCPSCPSCAISAPTQASAKRRNQPCRTNLKKTRKNA